MAWREPLVPGESVAVNGTCLTVARCDSTRFTADVLSETERRTGLAELKPGDKVNLERAMKANARLGGHIVQGHVDGRGVLVSKTPKGRDFALTFRCGRVLADVASPLYSKRWAEIVDAAKGDWSQLKMKPSLVSYIDRTYGVQNWRDPKSSALYWAHHGLALKPTGAVRAELRQVLYQTLMLEAVEDARFAPKALQAMREAYVEMPSQSLKDMILRFRAKFSL
ncbi:MAG: riboflavin synthase [Kiritimatiellae bacterium]|nr:riboflavin synthase [Kiritimatiellia bacterium]